MTAALVKPVCIVSPVERKSQQSRSDACDRERRRSSDRHLSESLLRGQPTSTPAQDCCRRLLDRETSADCRGTDKRSIGE